MRLCRPEKMLKSPKPSYQKWPKTNAIYLFLSYTQPTNHNRQQHILNVWPSAARWFGCWKSSGWPLPSACEYLVIPRPPGAGQAHRRSYHMLPCHTKYRFKKVVLYTLTNVAASALSHHTNVNTQPPLQDYKQQPSYIWMWTIQIWSSFPLNPKPPLTRYIFYKTPLNSKFNANIDILY